MELQQSPLYAKYISSLGWTIIRVDGVQMFYKKIPFLGGLLKIQRPKKLPDALKLTPVLRTYATKTVAIEPDEHQDLKQYKAWCKKIEKYCRVTRSNYMATKTILIDVTAPEKEIFARFTEAKRRAVRRAEKHGVTVIESQDIDSLIGIKNKSGGFFGFITTHGVDKLWQILAPDHKTVVLAYSPTHKLVGGVLLLFWGKTAFYWIAGATPEGKRLFAPTLLVWEALRIAKKHKAKQFDFVGVWDERKPNEHHDWLGFTKFKEGFGGAPRYYPVY